VVISGSTKDSDRLSTKLKDTIRDGKMTLGKKRRKGKRQQLL
jgi:hypothetical protein